MKCLITLACVGLVAGGLAVSGPANAAGCISGGAVGGLAGHAVGHGVVGAAAGCAIGHHEAKKQAKQQGATPASSTNTAGPANNQPATQNQ